MHPATTCRPDVAAAVRELSMHLVHPTERHVKSAGRVAQHLWTTKHLCLHYGRESGATTFYGTSDAAHNATHDCRGVTGWSFHLAGASIAWKSRAQDIVSLSSTESELIAVDEATRELRFLIKILKDFDVDIDQPVLLGQDNLSTITLINSTHFNARTRHVALRYHHCGEQQTLGALKIEHLSTDHIPSDVLTKQLDRPAHERHTAVLLGHRPLSWPARDTRISKGN